jgi:hypothetical protein
MCLDITSMHEKDDKDSLKAQLYKTALDSIHRLKPILNRQTGVYDKETFNRVPRSDYVGEDRELYKLYEGSVIGEIMLQKRRESLSARSVFDLHRPIPLVLSLLKQKSDEARLVSDLAFLSLNYAEDFINFCNDTLNNALDTKKYSDEFVKQLQMFYYRSENFINTFLSFYLSYSSKIRYVVETSRLTQDFKGDTNLLSVRVFQTPKEDVDKNAQYVTFSVDLKDSINKVLNYMFVDGKDNPFRLRIDRLVYFRDLTNTFTSYQHFDKVLLNQFIENILNQTNAWFAGVWGCKAFFIKRFMRDVLPQDLEFNVYGVEFKQQINIEKIGGLQID